MKIVKHPPKDTFRFIGVPVYEEDLSALLESSVGNLVTLKKAIPCGNMQAGIKCSRVACHGIDCPGLMSFNEPPFNLLPPRCWGWIHDDFAFERP